MMGWGKRSSEQRAPDIEGRLKRHRSGQLYDAAMGNNLAAVRDLIQSNADPNTPDEDGRLPLHAAAYIGNSAVVRSLREARADPNLRQGEDLALQIAAWQGHHGVTSALVEAGARVDAADGRGYTPLCSAAAQGHLRTVQVLVDSRADVGKKAEVAGLGVVSPLQAAVQRQHRKVAEVLKDAQNNPASTLAGRARTRTNSAASQAGAVVAGFSAWLGRLCSCACSQQIGSRIRRSLGK